MNTLFVIILRYIVPLSDIDAHRPAHIQFLDEYYRKGVFIASGRQNPPTGGVILACADSRATLENICHQDPFSINKLAEFNIYEVHVSKCSEAFQAIF
jgi:uncharacterized protein YciI